MAQNDPYWRNPARDIEVSTTVEVLVATTVVGWVGDQGTVLDTGPGNGPNFRIDYCDGRAGVGEVGRHVDNVVQEMWANAFRRDQVVSMRSVGPKRYRSWPECKDGAEHQRRGTQGRGARGSAVCLQYKGLEAPR